MLSDNCRPPASMSSSSLISPPCVTTPATYHKREHPSYNSFNSRLETRSHSDRSRRKNESRKYFAVRGEVSERALKRFVLSGRNCEKAPPSLASFRKSARRRQENERTRSTRVCARVGGWFRLQCIQSRRRGALVCRIRHQPDGFYCIFFPFPNAGSQRSRGAI